MKYEQYNDILDSFLSRWEQEDIETMTLQEYVGVDNKDTFCQWVETKTRVLGSIKGFNSIKFGIYERKNLSKKPKYYVNGDRYTWLKRYDAADEKAVFRKVHSDILKIVNASKSGRFEAIDDIGLPNLFKWKVAFLFSNERLAPIFNQTVLFTIANHFGMATNRRTKISEIQRLLISKKPAAKSVYHFMLELYNRFGNNNSLDYDEGKTQPKVRQPKKLRKRRPGKSRNTETQTRSGSGSHIAQQKHNKIQEALRMQLEETYGNECVLLEENFVDVKLVQPDYLGFYEVKSASYASDCVKQALGQVLLYTHNDEDIRPKKIYVVGQYPATDMDTEYINYIKKCLNIDFEYLSVAIDD
ncbi:hypothetical protein [uncultured Croceitalea sp.]|uniref:hypothetical protein n=1 Tax=uncultured Croceitalea sp. TaxID=1798908 RepID=UPI0033067622